MIVFVILVAFAICTAVILSLIDGADDRKEQVPKYSYDFFVPDFNKNIFADEGYLELNRYISYTEGATTTLIDDEDYAFYGPVVEFFAKYIDSVIQGDHERYNSFFSKEYIDANGKKDVFTMQQLYNIEIEYLGLRTIELDGKEYSLHEVALEYMIRQNNGTFRNDMGSDAIRRRAFQVIDRNGKLEILNMTTFYYAD